MGGRKERARKGGGGGDSGDEVARREGGLKAFAELLQLAPVRRGGEEEVEELTGGRFEDAVTGGERSGERRRAGGEGVVWVRLARGRGWSLSKVWKKGEDEKGKRRGRVE